MDIFFEGICRLGIFMICAQAIVHFRPNGSYEKYLKLLVSVMLLIQIFLPIAGLFAMDGKKNIELQIAQFEAKMQESMEKASATAAQTEDMLEQMTLEEVQERVTRQKEELQKETEQEATQQQEKQKSMQQELQPQEEQQTKQVTETQQTGEADTEQQSNIHIDEIVIEINP